MSKNSVVQNSAHSQNNTASSAIRLLTEILISANHHPDVQELKDICLEKLTFSLGTCIQHVVSPLHKTIDSTATSDTDFYLVGQGRVRLLGFDSQQNRWITLKVLEQGDWFGCDAHFFPAEAVAYQAVGASEGYLFRIPYIELLNLLERYPNLYDYLSKATCEYQRVAFFRTQSSLKQLSGKQIRELASHTVEQVIPPHTSLVDRFQDQQGMYWLRSGTIRCESGEVLHCGASWRGEEFKPDNCQALTQLLIYYLPSESLSEERGGNPLIINQEQLQTSSSSNLNVPLAIAQLVPTREELQPYSNTIAIRSSKVSSSAPQAEREKVPDIIFPKPLKRKVLDNFQRYPWVEQQSSSDCGAACLAMIARYWGKPFPISVLREKANVGRSGASLKSLARGADSIGFNARPVRASFGRIAEQTNPWIAHWEGDHYVVVYKIEPQRVILADPALGKRMISRDEFKRHWTGYALLLDPTERLKDTEVKQASLGRYLKLLVPYRATIVQILIVSLLIQIFSLVTPLFTQIILDKVVVQKSMSTLNVFAIGLLIFSVWTIIMTTVRNYLLAFFSMRLDLTMVSGFVKHAVALPLKFYETRRVGDIITRVQENQKIQRFLVGQVMLAWLGVLTGFVYLALMLYYNYRLTLLVLALVPPIIIVTLVSTPFLRKISREVFKEDAGQNSTLVEMINGIAAIKTVGVEHELRWRWENGFTQLKNVTFKGQKFGIGLEAANGTINTLGSTALLWVGAAMVIQNQLTIGQFVAFNMMIGYVLNPVVSLANLWDELQEIFISVERLNDVFETQPEETVGQSLSLPLIQGGVTFEKVTFRYDDDADVNTLENLSFDVSPGQTIAIVGRSGSGKTTLVKLLEGLYYPNQGRILIDGHDICHVSLHSLRVQLGVVPQECFLFSGTILENITLYRDGYTLEDVVEAAKLAEAHAFIQELPLGYQTKVGERGTTLSGGQRQRIAIARALLGDPRILVLDEATSSLDTESERRFQQNLSLISRDRTTFIIAHRLSTVRNADRILVLDHGVISEQGTHEDLIKMKGLYWSLAQQQLDL